MKGSEISIEKEKKRMIEKQDRTFSISSHHPIASAVLLAL